MTKEIELIYRREKVTKVLSFLKAGMGWTKDHSKSVLSVLMLANETSPKLQ